VLQQAVNYSVRGTL